MPSINPLSALTDIGAATSSQSTIATSFDTFLTLLTTQLQNQNPLEPLDANEFTQQLVQFSEVEQTIKSNENLENLLKLQAATAVTNSVSYIGKSVELSEVSQELTNNSATWPIEAANSADKATFTVSDANGNVVFSEQKAITSGSSEYTWNGKTDTGSIAPKGNYTLSISARNNEGVTIDTNVASREGTVTGVDMSGDTLYLLIGDEKVKIEKVSAIRQGTVN